MLTRLRIHQRGEVVSGIIFGITKRPGQYEISDFWVVLLYFSGCYVIVCGCSVVFVVALSCLCVTELLCHGFFDLIVLLDTKVIQSNPV